MLDSNSNKNFINALRLTHSLGRDEVQKTAALAMKARRAREDPVEFAEFCFADETGQPMRLPQVHRELHEFLTNAPRGLVEMPRDHGKTTQVMIRGLWELGRNPNLRILLVCGSSALAQQRGRFLRDAIANNPRVHRVFPHLKPERPWRASLFRVHCSGNSVSPSVVVLGIGAQATGSRADLLICDDVVDVRALRSQTIRDKTKTIYRENFVNMLEPNGRAWMLFTPWHAGDLNAELKQNPKYQQFRRAVGNDLEPVWRGNGRRSACRNAAPRSANHPSRERFICTRLPRRIV
jgi:hypothetical protein